MINQEYLANFIKQIRKDYSLSQGALARILMVDVSLISHYENMRKMPSWENINRLCEHFGYELTIVPVESNERKSYQFYGHKTYHQLCEMYGSEILDYVFVSQEDDVLMNICGISKDIFHLIPLDAVKNILAEKLRSLSRLALYFMINRMYVGAEEEMVRFITEAKRWLKNKTIITDELFNSIKYIEAEVYFSGDGSYDNQGSFFGFDYYGFLDENKQDIEDKRLNKYTLRHSPVMDDTYNYIDIDGILEFNAGKCLYEEYEQKAYKDEFAIIPLYY